MVLVRTWELGQLTKLSTRVLQIVPDQAVDVVGDQMIALTDEPWLRLEPLAELTRHRWISLRYDASYFDNPVRPLIRFMTARGEDLPQPMNGPILGSGEWIGRVPGNTVVARLSPVGAPGRFNFNLRSIEPVSRLALVGRGMRRDRASLMLSFGAKIINARQERWDTLKFAATATPLEQYDAWHRRLYRPIDMNGLDRPRADWTGTPTIRLFMPLRPGNLDALRETLESLRRQVYPRWSLRGIVNSATPPDLLSAFRAYMSSEPRVSEAANGVAFPDAVASAEDGDVVATVLPGDIIPDYAFAVVAERLAGAPHIRVLYGDEDSVDTDGKLHSPLFKPDWSPIFSKSVNYLGRSSYVRVKEIADPSALSLERFVDDFITIVATAAARMPHKAVGHARRILYRRRREPGEDIKFRRIAASVPYTVAVSPPECQPDVAIVIPTRDRAALLSKCVVSLRQHTEYPHYKIVIVDNGSQEADALALLKDLSGLPDVNVLRRPGPFNFSALCNEGASAVDTPMLVFLNNDTIFFDPSWLAALVKYAVRPDVGVVGAMLRLPNNYIQHAGVVLGHCGIAGHLYVGQPSADAGYLDQLTMPREVSAVTGACIAIERTKFEAAGSFDAQHLPVDLNDIDLCLRASEKGWAAIWTPQAVLYHLHSATRGFPLKPTTLYDKERRYFVQRWPKVIRDDPYLHPGLSLYSNKPALA